MAERDQHHPEMHWVIGALQQFCGIAIALLGTMLGILNWQGQALSDTEMEPGMKTWIALCIGISVAWYAFDGRSYGKPQDRPAFIPLAPLLSVFLLTIEAIGTTKFFTVLRHRSQEPWNRDGYCPAGDAPCLEEQAGHKHDLKQDTWFGISLAVMTGLSAILVILSVFETVSRVQAWRHRHDDEDLEDQQMEEPQRRWW